METVKAARHNTKMWQMLEKVVYGGDSFSFFLGHGMMIFAILVHAKRIKSNERVDAVLAACGYSEEYMLMQMVDHGSENVSGNNSN